MGNTAQILEFLSKLKQHNEREWMEEHRKEYHAARDLFLEMIAEQIQAIAQWEKGVASLSPKDCVFRINRDIRFSKDKRPYKENFGAFIAKGGRHTPSAGYYLHLEPGNTFVGGGIYMPPNDLLKKIRQEIDYNAAQLHAILNEPIFVKTFGEIQGERLKSAPKGYPKDHPEIHLLQLKSFVVTQSFADDVVASPEFQASVTQAFKVLQPFNAFLEMAVASDDSL